MNSYGYTQIKIENLQSIEKKGNNFYNFKGINFLSKMNPQNTKIVFIFHGASPKNVKQKVIFRGYDYDITAIFKKSIVFSNKNIAFFKYICKNIKASTLPLIIYN